MSPTVLAAVNLPFKSNSKHPPHLSPKLPILQSPHKNTKMNTNSEKGLQELEFNWHPFGSKNFFKTADGVDQTLKKMDQQEAGEN